MTGTSVLALLGALVVLAAIPSLSVLVVTTRSATLGFHHGALTTLGIVVGDCVFIAIALGGLSLLMTTLGTWAVLIKLLGGAYLIFLGMRLLRGSLRTGLRPSRGGDAQILKPDKTSLFSSFLTGLLITLGDQKATLFYLGFFPAFVDLTTLQFQDVAVILALAVVAVGGVKLIYALMAERISGWLNTAVKRRLNGLAGIVMIAIGLFLILRQ
ncbi:MAG: LysE family translocator [Leptolyngbya sp.]|nr:LysE family translocator [Leptolyngbya sp.]